MKKELMELIEQNKDGPSKDIAEEALNLKIKNYGKSIYVRGLIEFTSYCKNDCLYCGIRRGNKNAVRYRLSEEQILSCCDEGYNYGFRTFVLQGGEDEYFNVKRLCGLVNKIKTKYPECAVTLSVGEKSREEYSALKSAGADRYLLRHETANEAHYNRLHPSELSLSNRKRCLYDLKELGFQTGAGFMVGSPYQTYETLAEDLMFLKELEPHMVGIGPFIAQKDSVFKDEPNGSLGLTLTMLALTRIILPDVLLPATTALGTIAPDGREKGFLVGANVVMPNLSPQENRVNYALYDNKISSGAESASGLGELRKRAESVGMEIDMQIGNWRKSK